MPTSPSLSLSGFGSEGDAELIEISVKRLERGLHYMEGRGSSAVGDNR